MKNNLFKKIAIKVSNLRKTQLNFAHDVSTTAGFGELQQTTCKLVMPNSNGTTQSKTLVRFAPMVAPTFGRVRSKEYHTLVPVSDLSKNIPALLAQGRVARGSNIFEPQFLPHMTLGYLSRYCLVGAEVSMYRQYGDGGDDNALSTYFIGSSEAGADTMHGQNSWIDDYIQENAHSVEFSGFVGTLMNVDFFTRDWAISKVHQTQQDYRGTLWIPIRNKNAKTLFGVGSREVVRHTSGGQDVVVTEYYEHSVPLESADLLYSFRHNGIWYTLAFRLSSFGKRLRKAIVGAGYQVNLSSTAPVEIMSLFATWKAYFDLFGLTQYDNYEVTNLAQVTTHMDFHNITNFDSLFNESAFCRFMVDLGNMWYTDAQDFVSAHQKSTAISPSFGLSRQFIDVTGGPNTANVSEVDNSDGSDENGHSFINNVIHGELDAEYLKRLYVWCNRNTVAGKAIEKVLRAQNLGKYVDSCKSNFIGYHEELLPVMDVVSTADTMTEAGKGSLLGEYGGRGLKVFESGKNSYSVDEYAFRVSLFTIVPDAGYLQSIDPSKYAIDKLSLYNPDFDGLGMEATRKTLVCGAENWSSESSFEDNANMDDNFGFVPRYSALKVGHSVANGDFTLRGVRDVYLPYTLDKFIDVGERGISEITPSGAQGVKVFATQRQITPKMIPNASNAWRYPTRYPWLGNFRRIFANVGEPLDPLFYKRLHDDNTEQSATWEFLVNLYDCFIVHEIVNEQCYSPCKPIEECFGTFDDEEKPNARIEKA